MPAPALRAFTSPRTRVAAVAALTLAGTVLAGTPAAFAAPGDNGDVKIHAMGTLFTDQSNNPKVCGFYLDGFNFDTIQSVTWNISPQPARAGGATLNGALQLMGGTGHTLPLTLPDGQYKLVWNITGGSGAAKQKVFKVDCTPASASTGGTPRGGVPAGGGGLAETPGIPQAGAAAGLGLVSIAGVLYVRRLRRRPHGPA
uniref:LPXTG cell wall anchor domain-containing protein n=1 Tax=Streptomyces sp. NBC_00003 TaxID=2903608 RepID=A0AAU2UXJ0_9ACTN